MVGVRDAEAPVVMEGVGVGVRVRVAVAVGKVLEVGLGEGVAGEERLAAGALGVGGALGEEPAEAEAREAEALSERVPEAVTE